MPIRIQLPFVVGLLLWHGAAAAQEVCSPDCTHPTKACVCAIDARNVLVTPIGGIDRQPAQIRRALNPGDEIAGFDEAGVVALTCPGSSDVKLHGRFRAVIMPPAQGQDCALNLLAGNVDILTSTPTQVGSGETLMGSKRTMYSMRVAPDATVECAVYEGEVAVQNLKTGATRPLAAGVKASWKGGALVQYGVPLAPADLVQATRVYARGDMARARALGVAVEDPVSFQRALQARYAAVLSKPDDPAALIDLAALQTIARVSTPALHHLERAERLKPQLTEQRAALAATKWIAYRQVGRDTDAAAESEKLKAIDPARLAAIQQLDPNVRRLPRAAYERPGLAVRPLGPVVTAMAMPPSVAAGQATTIVTTVRTNEGKPIGRAKVVLSAGGGAFSTTGQARIEGATDANGVFRETWMCRPCAAAYRITVEVAAPSLEPRTVFVDIRTR